jgi:hypothetical protein
LPAALADRKLESVTGTIRSNIRDGISDESLLVCLTVGVLMPRRQPDPAGTPARLADTGQRP